MSTEAKIKHTTLELGHYERQADHWRVRTAVDGHASAVCIDDLVAEVRHLTSEIARKDSVFAAACAEVGQSRRLLEAGERLIQATREADSAAIRECVLVPLPEYDALVAAYQEAAK